MPLTEHNPKTDTDERQNWTTDSTFMLLANSIGTPSVEVPADQRAPKTDPPAATTQTATSAPGQKAKEFPRWRVFKIAAAGLVLAAGLYATLLPRLVVTSDTAVVSAYLT